MKKIMVPTDFSPTAEKAFRFALNLASYTNGTVILYHVYTPVESTFIDTEQKRRAYNAQIEIDALKRLQRLKKKVAGENCAITIDTAVGRSPLTDNILGFAEHHAIDLIVIGTQGASGLKKVIIGSEASRIAEESDIPVLLIPEKFEWKEPRQIVFASSYAPSELNAIHLAVALTQLYGGSLTITHLFSPAIHLFSPDTNEAMQDKISQFTNFAMHLQKIFTPFPLHFKPVPTTELTETMENLHKEVPYDILIMVRRNKTFLQRLFLKSFTKAMCYVTAYPLLIVPADYVNNTNLITQANSSHEHLHHTI